MKVILLQCNWRYHDSIYPDLGSTRPYQPIELCYIGSLLEQNHSVFLIDAFRDNLSLEEIALKISDIEPDIVVTCTANTYLFWRCCFPDIEVVSQTIRTIKKQIKVKTLLIGPHGTIEPQWTLKKSGADFIICGEPELAVKEFIDSSFQNIHITGLYGRDIRNNTSAVVSDLSELPLPAFHLLDMEKYHCHSWVNNPEFNFQRGVLLEYSRGCMFNCAFCFRKGFRQTYRVKPADKIINEVKMVKDEYGVDYIFFIDDIFNVDNDNFRRFLRQLKDLNISYGCQCRPDIMTKELVDLMQESGCIYIEYGLESLNPVNRKRLKKNEEIIKTMRIINYTKTKIKFVTFNLLDFTTFDLITETENISRTNEGDSILQITSETDALETIILFPKTELSEFVSELFHIKDYGWEDTIRLYWLSSLFKMISNPKKSQIVLWRWICLHMPFSLLKKVIRYKIKSKPLPLTYVRKLKAN
ncbi:B12-binding domain-containing radical SAM protein [Ruminiclostridium papyrosolvens]|uniref:Radical SAM core domain-containing protein n=1 Tax=Ruminiclostridium papyrosolvens C7 TaxID=1330534 RepID=U4QZZ8_9FIRM|nr:B12-binding domain-containing radical SAM protein [Ruminiclostridium papyrosolvens]EPR10582.1 hypothetical protein L323_13770 [Ruminiclostridium papyrosolvens C7]